MDDAKKSQPPIDPSLASQIHLAEVNRGMVKGAVWTVAMRAFIRGIGLISMAILARILVPADFGLVALATMILGFVEIMSDFGLNVILIQNQKAGRDYYDTVWTLSIIRGVLTCVLLSAIAVPVAGFFDDPRLVEIMYVLAVVALVQSSLNVGIVNFVKELRFDKDFKYEAIVKLAMFCATISTAFALRSYWALVIGFAAGGLVRVALSYIMHPYRPRFSLARWREIMHFSKWLLVANFLSFVNMRSHSLIVGKILGAATLGLYTVAAEIASLVTSELLAPIRRALLPGYAKLTHDLETMGRNYLQGLALILMLGAPAAAGIGLVADPMVRLFLGDKWLAAIPLLQVLTISGLLQATMANIGPVLLALGRPQLLTMMTAINLAVGLPLFIWATLQWGVIGTVWALVAVTSVAAIVACIISIRVLRLSVRNFVSTLWRTPVSICGMVVAVVSADIAWASDGTIAALVLQLAVEVSLGVGVYVALHLSLWYMAGAPKSAERHVLTFFSARFNQLRRFSVNRT